MKINQYEFLKDKPIIETNRETGTMKIDDIEFNAEQTKAISHLLEAFEKKTRHQVCEDIRMLVYPLDIIKDEQSCAGKYVFERILDQIERGE